MPESRPDRLEFTHRVVQSAAIGTAATLGIVPGPGPVLGQAGAVDGALLARGKGAGTGGALGSGGHDGREGEGEGDNVTHGVRVAEWLGM